MKTLVSFPTAQTKQRLQQIFMSSPIEVDFNKMLLVIAVVQDDELLPEPGTVNPFATYSARFTEYGIRTDVFRESSELVGVVTGQKLAARAQELGMPKDFQQKLIFLPYAPSQSSTVRSFNVSIADTLVLREEEPFTFEGEGVL